MQKRLVLVVIVLMSALSSFGITMQHFEKETARLFARKAAHEVVNGSIGQRTFTVGGVNVVSTQDAAMIAGDLALMLSKKQLHQTNAIEACAQLYLREKLIGFTHWLLKDQCGLGLPKWVQDSPTCLNIVSMGERFVGNMASAVMIKGIGKAVKTQHGGSSNGQSL